MRAVSSRRAEKLFLVVSAMVVGGCATFSHTANSPDESAYPLLVNNRTEFEVVVYALPQGDGPGDRLGNARSLARTTMHVPRNMLMGSETLMLRLHAVGTSTTMNWTSQATSIDGDVVAEVDVRADATGNLGHSVLYTVVGSVARATRPPGHLP